MSNQFQKRNENAQAHLPRSGHSLSHKFGFTLPCGPIVPTFWDYATPGDKYSLSVDFDLSRALPLLQPACLDIEVCTDYFFVPMDLMRLDFGERYNGTNQIFSRAAFSATKSHDDSDFPRVQFVTNNMKNMRFFHGVSPFDCVGKESFRLLDMFGFNPLFITPKNSSIHPDFGNTSTQFYNNTFRPSQVYYYMFPFLAYQAIYQYYYRDEEHETFDNECFNIDDIIAGGTLSTSAISGSHDTTVLPVDRFWGKIFQLRYVNRRADYFTDVMRSALINNQNLLRSVSGFGADKFGLHSWLSGNLCSPVAVDKLGELSTSNSSSSVGSKFVDLSPDVDNVGNQQTLSSILNTAGLRAMFAQEKLLRLTSAAKKNYDDQTLAHLGVSVPHDVKHQITHFGRNVMKYKVSEVVSTAQTQEAPLGEQAGRLYGANVNDKQNTFTAPVHGVVMALTFIRPVYSYLAPEQRIAMYNNISDFWRAEYDHIGMQPIFRREVQFNAWDVVGTGSVGLHANDVVGWQYRWSELKKRFNRVSHAFANGQYQPYILATSPNNHITKGLLVDNHRVDFNWLDNASPFSFKVSPSDTDAIFGSQYISTWQSNRDLLETLLGATPTQADLISVFGSDNVALYGLDATDSNLWTKIVSIFCRRDYDSHPEQVYYDDPFQLNANIHCKKVSLMSQNSLPKMDM